MKGSLGPFRRDLKSNQVGPVSEAGQTNPPYGLTRFGESRAWISPLIADEKKGDSPPAIRPLPPLPHTPAHSTKGEQGVRGHNLTKVNFQSTLQWSLHQCRSSSTDWGGSGRQTVVHPAALRTPVPLPLRPARGTFGAPPHELG